MKKGLIVFIVLVAFVVGIVVGINLAERYTTRSEIQGLQLIKTDRLTGKIEIWKMQPGGTYKRIQIIKGGQ